MEEDSDVVPTFEFWIVVSDRLLTHCRLWQATEASIRDAVEGRCTVSLSITSAAGLKAGKRSGDEYACDRLNTSIILYRAKRDDPKSRRGGGRKIWAEARDRFHVTDAAFQPACVAFREAERAYFALQAGRGADLTDEEDNALKCQTGLDIAMAEEQRLGAELHEATMALLHTPASDLAAIASKLELVRDAVLAVGRRTDARWAWIRAADPRSSPGDDHGPEVSSPACRVGPQLSPADRARGTHPKRLAAGPTRHPARDRGDNSRHSYQLPPVTKPEPENLVRGNPQ